MKFIVDHDYHIHSHLSICSGDENQTAEAILNYAKRNGLREICITDHLWIREAGRTNEFYSTQDFEHVSQILPLPQDEKVQFFFGCEVEMDKDLNIGMTAERAECFDFIIVPTTHLHFKDLTIDPAEDSNERRAYHYIERIHALTEKNLPFEKVGLAHPTCPLIAPRSWEDHLQVLDMISDTEFREAYGKIAAKGIGFELNFNPDKYTAVDLQRVLRPYRIAKEVGCKFYFGSDAHNTEECKTAVSIAKKIVDLLELKEEDKYRFQTVARRG